VLAIIYLVCSLVIALSWEFKSLESIIPSFVASLIYPIDKSHLAPERLLHFLSLALVISRLTPPNWEGPIRPLLTAMIRSRENSLVIYCLSVLLAFVAQALLVEVSGTAAMQAEVSFAGIAIMVASATLLTWESKLDRRGPRLF